MLEKSALSLLLTAVASCSDGDKESAAAQRAGDEDDFHLAIASGAETCNFGAEKSESLHFLGMF